MNDPGGRLADNLVYFARVLRGAGLPVGPGKVLDALQAVQAVGVERRADFYWALHAALVTRREQHPLFEQAFHVFWRNPKLLERLLSLSLPSPPAAAQPQQPEPLQRRLAEALAGEQHRPTQREEREIDASLTWSQQEQLRNKDFEQMSTAELAQARRMLEQLRLHREALPTRRWRPAAHGQRVDLRATLRRSLRGPSGLLQLERHARRQRPPALVLLCDISGSMERYARLVLHFAHTVSSHRDRVHAFVFGTRLTNVSRELRHKDVDQALAEVSRIVPDWSGGTRIGPCLHEFNRDWSRRVLGQGALVLFISDGLDRASDSDLGREMERLHKSCRRLIWLNPLLRYSDFQPRAQGIRAILPHVDELRPAHNVNSLSALAAALDRPLPRREEGVSRWQQMLS